MSTVISVEQLSKIYRLGQIGTGTFARDLNVWWANVRGKPNPMLRIGESEHGNREGEEIWALKDVSFTVQQGEVLGIIGRNGAGKSTLLKILSRVTAPTSGKIKVKGRVASLLEVGTGFHPELTGRENIHLNGAILGMNRREIERRFDEIVDFAEVEQFIDTPIKRYSSGMFVRLAFAVAAHLEPEILVVDEVLAVGDVAFQKKCLGKMGDVAKGGRTVLFVSHQMAAVKKLCPRAILLDSGLLRLDNSSNITITHYLRRSIAGENSSKVYQVKRELLNFHKDKPFTISDIQLLAPNNEDVQNLGTGDPLLIRIFYKAQYSILAPAFVVSIKNSYGVEISRLSTMPISGYFIEKLEGDGYIDLFISSLPMTGGLYYLDLALARANVEFLVKMDEIVEFELTSRDIYKSGLAIDQNRGLITLNHAWNLRKFENVSSIGR